MGVVVYFRAKKVFGQYTLRKAFIDIDNTSNMVKIKKYIMLNVSPGTHTVSAYAKTLFGKACNSETTFSFEDGKTYEINWKSRVLVFLKGKLTINELTDTAYINKIDSKARKN
jgi:hypothetical protein